jgi:hypothetical protein
MYEEAFTNRLSIPNQLNKSTLRFSFTPNQKLELLTDLSPVFVDNFGVIFTNMVDK